MKLALVRQTYTPYGGAERFVERALAALREQGTDVTIIARNWQGDIGPGFLRCNPFYLGRTWRDAGFARCVRKIIAEGHFDLVQSHERIPGCHIYRAGDGVHATWLELRSRARGVLPRLTSPKGAGRHEVAVPSDQPEGRRTPRSGGPERSEGWGAAPQARDGALPHSFALSPWHRYTLVAEAALFRHPDLRAVICNSRMVRDDIARRFPEAAGKLHVIYNGVDLDHFHPRLRGEHREAVRSELAISNDVPVILFVGSGFERKGVPTLLGALARMTRKDAQLVVVGRDRHEDRMRRLAHDLGIGRRVRFLGGQKDVRPFYGTADVFALPTLYDPMPNAALEALACGLPVVTSTTCGAAELIEPDVTGFVCDALAIDELARNLDSACASPFATDVVRKSVIGLDIGSMAARLLGLYRSLTG